MNLNRHPYTLLFVMLFALTQANAQQVPQDLTDAEKNQAQKVAQLFVKRIQETRDVGVLINELFATDFVEKYACDVDNLHPSYLAILTASERRRLFVAHINASYLLAIDTLARDKTIKEPPLYDSVLSKALAEKVRKILGDKGRPFQFSSYQEFRSRLPLIEKQLVVVRDYLKQHAIEQTPEFQKRLDDEITDEGLGYSTELGFGEWYVTVCPEYAKVPAKEKLYYVTTPLFFAVVLRMERGHMKIVALTDADDD